MPMRFEVMSRTSWLGEQYQSARPYILTPRGRAQDQLGIAGRGPIAELVFRVLPRDLPGTSKRGSAKWKTLRMDLPQLFVTGLDEQRRFTFKPWCPPPVGDFAAPADLARIITAFREWVRSNTGPTFRPITEQGALSEQGLGRLLLLANQASYFTDEGRYT